MARAENGMAQKIPERLIWAVDTLDLKPDDRVLEIGCGHGNAVALVCERLNGGRITAIDRSQAMIDMAIRRNSAFVVSGKATFHCVALRQASFDGETFDKIFAVNVNVFWQQPAAELDVIRKILKNDGSLYLIYEPPSADKTRQIAAKLQANLQTNGFCVEAIRFRDSQTASMVCAHARPA